MHKPLMTLLFTALLALTLGACASPAPDAAPPAGADPVALAADDPLNLDSSCRVDSDCEVKNVGNCCGHFPACVNKDAQPDPEAVQARCAETGMASVCGFREIQSCSCVDNRCEAVRQSLRAPLE
ncbi:MAG: hypothetical protein ACTHZI_07055 [Luteimonas sp.]